MFTESATRVHVTWRLEFYTIIVYRFMDCEELGGCLSSQLLGYMLPGGLNSILLLYTGLWIVKSWVGVYGVSY